MQTPMMPCRQAHFVVDQPTLLAQKAEGGQKAGNVMSRSQSINGKTLYEAVKVRG